MESLLAHPRRTLIGIALLALMVRLLAIVYFRTYEISSDLDHWNFGYEAGRIARSLATGQGFSSPMPRPSGPTGHLAPAFPFLLAVVFRVFGIYTTASAIAIYVFDAVLSALTCVALYTLGARMFGQTTGLAAAMFFALYPPSIWHASGTIWDTTLLTFGLVALMSCVYDLPPVPMRARLASIGLLMGLLILISPVPGVFYPVIVIWLWHRLAQNSGRKWAGLQGAAILTLSCFLVSVPWMIRNAVKVGEFAPRTASGLQLRLGNYEGAWEAHGNWSLQTYPSNSATEEKLYEDLGEAAYDRYCARLAVDYIRRNPGTFAGLIGYRILSWWSGNTGGEWKGNWQTSFSLARLKALIPLVLLALAVIGCIAAWRSGKSIGLLLALILIYPIPYYVSYVSDRYRFPIEPFLFLLATFGVVASASGVLRYFAKPDDRKAFSAKAGE
jgi:4-amino-4-deoxy-L-arabinose transferase-like glycosyltransferase